MKLSKLGHWVRADIGKINRSRCPIFPSSWKQIYIYIKALSSKVNACSLSPCRSTWAWGHKVWWKRELGWSAHGQEHLWHFILLWKWCNVALTLLSPEKMNQVQTEPKSHHNMWFLRPKRRKKKTPAYWSMTLEIWIYDWLMKYIKKHHKWEFNCFTQGEAKLSSVAKMFIYKTDWVFRAKIWTLR